MKKTTNMLSDWVSRGEGYPSMEGRRRGDGSIVCDAKEQQPMGKAYGGRWASGPFVLTKLGRMLPGTSEVPSGLGEGAEEPVGMGALCWRCKTMVTL